MCDAAVLLNNKPDYNTTLHAELLAKLGVTDVLGKELEDFRVPSRVLSPHSRYIIDGVVIVEDILIIEHYLGDALAIDCDIAVAIHLCSGQLLDEVLDVIFALGINYDGAIGTFVAPYLR